MSSYLRYNFWFLALLSQLVSLTTVSAQEELKRVRFGYPSLGFRQGHIWVAKDEGIFKKYGLDVEPIFLRGGQLAIQALAGGDPPLMSIGQVVQAWTGGVRSHFGRRCRNLLRFHRLPRGRKLPGSNS